MALTRVLVRVSGEDGRMVGISHGELHAEHSGAGDDRVVFRPDARTTRPRQEAPTWTGTWNSFSSDLSLSP